MKPMVTACERCGYGRRASNRGGAAFIMNFCDECYWGEVQPVDRAEPWEEQPVSPRAGEAASQ